jgi:hypothetical protein
MAGPMRTIATAVVLSGCGGGSTTANTTTTTTTTTTTSAAAAMGAFPDDLDQLEAVLPSRTRVTLHLDAAVKSWRSLR